MRKIYAVLLFTFTLNVALAQKLSDQKVKYMVSFDNTSKIFTAWVVPEYNTPNYNNGDKEEKGATAQFSLKVPKGFEISTIQSVVGEWESKPMKLGSEEEFIKAGVDKNFEYYIIGKSPSETNYGEFKSGEPIVLFNFKAVNATNPSLVSVLETNDQFVKIAQEIFSLNVGSSFYSRSGQAPKVDAVPLEQFKTQTTFQAVITEVTQKLDEATILSTEKTEPNSVVIMFPNPASETINVKFFSAKASEIANIYLYSTSGNELQHHEVKSQLGFNNLALRVSSLPDGTYTVKTVIGEIISNKKIVKIAY
jgi:Secretion system C-terminal sorting domain